METTDASIKRIAGKLQQVLQQYQGLLKEHEHLTKDMAAIKQREQSQLKKIDELETKVAAIKTATGRLEEGEKKEVDKRISQYIREIDRCIAQLSE
jgi:uncharacterized protein YoxC